MKYNFLFILSGMVLQLHSECVQNNILSISFVETENLSVCGTGILNNVVITGESVLSGPTLFLNPVHISDTSSGSGCDNGSLVVDGDVGIGGNLYVCGIIIGENINTFILSNTGNCNLSVGDNTNDVDGSDGVTAVGENALENNQGNYNTALGCQALQANVDGTQNVGIGYQPLLNSTGASANVAIGFSPMQNPLGVSNIAIGLNTMKNASGANWNIALGEVAMDESENIHDNVAIGFAAMHTTEGDYNVALGSNAFRNSNGNQNIAIGRASLMNSVDATDNVGIGYQALGNGNAASNNVAVGPNTMTNASGFINNVAIGNGAMQNAKSSVAVLNNVAIGTNSLLRNTGTDNVAVGRSTLNSLRSGWNNIAIGSGAGANLTNAESNNIYFGNRGVAGESNTIRLGLAGTHLKTFIAGIRGVTTTNTNAIPVLIDSAGQLGTISSSERFKKNIVDIDDQSEKILELRPVSFVYSHDNDNNKQYGLIAEEVFQVYPELIIYDEEGKIYTINYLALIPILLKQIQSQDAQIQELRDLISK